MLKSVTFIFDLFKNDGISVLLLNRTYLMNNKYKDHGILFCFATMICTACNTFYSFSVLSIYYDYIPVLSRAIRIFHVYSILIYFSGIAKILVLFNVFGSKIIYYISKIAQYILILLGLIEYIRFYSNTLHF